jgi:hypothetical protein
MAADHLDPLSELAAFDSAAQELLRLCDDDPARLGAVASAVSGWSALGHVAHVSLANELVLKNLASLQKGEGLLVQREATPNPEALRVHRPTWTTPRRAHGRPASPISSRASPPGWIPRDWRDSGSPTRS